MRLINLQDLSVANFRRNGQQIITNAQTEPDLRDGFADFGITEDDLAVGQDLHDVFSEAALRYQELRGEEDIAIQKRNTFIEAFEGGLLARHVARANVAFSSDPGAKTKLRLTTMSTDRLSLGEWLERTEHFYAILLTDDALYDKVAACKVTRDELEEGQRTIAEAAELDQKHVALVGLRQQARRTRDEHRDALEDWLRDLQEKARHIFSDRPDLLELLGFVVPSRS